MALDSCILGFLVLSADAIDDSRKKCIRINYWISCLVFWTKLGIKEMLIKELAEEFEVLLTWIL